MSREYRNRQRRRFGGRNFGSTAAALALLGLLTLGPVGCNEDEAWNAFRSASRSSLESGLNNIMDGVVSGLFAIYDLGADNTDSSGSSSTSN